MRARRTAAAALLTSLVAAAALAGCGDDGDDGGAAAPSSTAAAVTTTAEGTGSTAATSPPSTAAGPAAGDLGDVAPRREDGPSGSGCSPGSGPMPDGWWYATPELTFDAADGTYTFDLACYYVGAAAEAEAARRGDEVNNEYYVVNDNPALRTLPLADGATATCVEMTATVREVACSPADIPDAATPWAVWLRVVDGEIDRLVEQYAP